MDKTDFSQALRRIVTGENNDGQSTVIIDGPPLLELGSRPGSGLHEIWTEEITRALDPADWLDRGAHEARLSPHPGSVKVRWFVVEPIPPEVDAERLNSTVRTFFRYIDAEHELADQNRHPTMHRTSTLDVVCLIHGNASLVVDNIETPLSPGQVVIQRGTAHAWKATDGPALFLAVLIGREINKC